MAMKRCMNCKKFKVLDDANFIPKPENKSGWRSSCRACWEAAKGRVDGRRRCSTCKQLLELNGDNFQPRKDRPGGWYPQCRACGRSRDRNAYVRKVYAGPDRPRPDESSEAREAREAGEREREILLLIRRYEATRFEPGRDRDAAYNRLALRLWQHARPVSDGERQWEWSKGLGEVTSRLIRRVWRAPEDPHADPRRMSRSEMRTAGVDLVEI